LIFPDAITITRNTGELTSRGAELEINALVVKGFEINYNAGYTKATYNALTVSQNSTAVNLQGKRQIFSPDVTSMLALQYNINIGKKKGYEIFIRSEWKYLGRQYFDLANTIKQDPYNLFNARFGVALKNILLTFSGQNLSNKKHIQYGYDFGAVRLGTPLLFGATVRVKR